MNRTKSIKIRLTDNEHRQLRARAGARGVSALLRIQALGPDHQQERRGQFALVAELARARNLLNQIARNSERRMPSQQIEIVSQLIAVERQLSNFKIQ